MLLGYLCLFAPPTCHCGHQKLSSCQDLSAPWDRWDGNWPAETWLEIVCMLTVCPNPLFLLESPGTGFTPCKAEERVCDNGSTLVRIAYVSVHPFSPYVQGPTLSLLPETGKLVGTLCPMSGAIWNSRRSSRKGPCSCLGSQKTMSLLKSWPLEKTVSMSVAKVIPGHN